MPRVTIADIANEAGVSKTTVSRYLNGRYDSMSEDTRETIGAIIARLNYYPNASARSLKSRKSRLIGVMISVTDNSRLISHLLQGICGQLKANAYNPILYDCVAGDEEKVILECLSQNLDGLIVHPSSADVSVYDRIAASGMPLVLVDRFVPSWKYDAVYINNAAAVEKTMSHLCESGFEQVYFLTANTSPVSTKVMRQKAFVEYVRTNMQVADAEARVLQVPLDAEGVEDVLRSVLKVDPKVKKAVFAVDSEVLFVTLSAIANMGLRMPHDLGVCGYDNWGWAALVPPGVTCVTQPINEMAAKAVQLLMKRLDNGAGKRVSRVKLDADVMVRGSTLL